MNQSPEREPHPTHRPRAQRTTRNDADLIRPGSHIDSAGQALADIRPYGTTTPLMRRPWAGQVASASDSERRCLQ